MNGWHDIGAASDVSDDAPLAAQVGEREIGIYKVGDCYYAMENICPHAYALLSQGFVEGDEIECPLHQGKFDVRTGKAMCEPLTTDIRTFPVKVEGGDVYVKLESSEA